MSTLIPQHGDKVVIEVGDTRYVGRLLDGKLSQDPGVMIQTIEDPYTVIAPGTGTFTMEVTIAVDEVMTNNNDQAQVMLPGDTIERESEPVPLKRIRRE